ncbi:MAG: DUF983 domain-containing protein [Hyphomicrobium sp.]|nr:DUF983 domain-containing protein [Hyphomicrobium sp.]
MDKFYTNVPADTFNDRPWPKAVMNGIRCTCPRCGTGKLYESYLKVVPVCQTCGEELHHQRADDAPPYFTMFIVGHIIIGGLLVLEQTLAPATWVHLVIWLPLTLFLSLWLLPKVKGGLVGLQWALRMHGFGGETDEPDPEPQPASQA